MPYFHWPLFACGALCGAVYSPLAASAGDEPAAISDHQQAAAQFIKPFFNEIDCEGLGYVQLGEVDEHSGPIFLSFDVDRSRAIDRREWQSYPFIKSKPLLALSFASADTDRNGKVDAMEFYVYMNSAVDLLDRDGDGDVYPADLAELLPRD